MTFIVPNPGRAPRCRRTRSLHGRDSEGARRRCCAGLRELTDHCRDVEASWALAIETAEYGEAVSASAVLHDTLFVSGGPRLQSVQAAMPSIAMGAKAANRKCGIAFRADDTLSIGSAVLPRASAATQHAVHHSRKTASMGSPRAVFRIRGHRAARQEGRNQLQPPIRPGAAAMTTRRAFVAVDFWATSRQLGTCRSSRRGSAQQGFALIDGLAVRDFQ